MRVVAPLLMSAVLGFAVAAPAVEQTPDNSQASREVPPAAAPDAEPQAAPGERSIPPELEEVVAHAATLEGSSLPIGTMSELMVDIIYPTSDAILYITTRTPTNEVEWNELQGKALMLAESANLLMMPSRVMVPEKRWRQDAQLMLDAGAAAYEAARNRDLAALEELNQAVYDSCVVCHLHYRPDYGK